MHNYDIYPVDMRVKSMYIIDMNKITTWKRHGIVGFKNYQLNEYCVISLS